MDSTNPAISANGRFVAWDSDAHFTDDPDYDNAVDRDVFAAGLAAAGASRVARSWTAAANWYPYKIEVWEKDPSIQAFTDLMNRAIEVMGAEVYKKYRVYEKSLK